MQIANITENNTNKSHTANNLSVQLLKLARYFNTRNIIFNIMWIKVNVVI